MSNKAEYNEEVLRQQESIRMSGHINMFDKAGVKDLAKQMGFNELVEFLNENDADTYIDMAERAREYADKNMER